MDKSYHVHIVPQVYPCGLTVSSKGTTFLFVTWHMLNCDQQNGPSVSYLIEYMASATTHTVLTNSTYYNLTGMEPCTLYSVRVAAVNEAGMSALSASVSETTDAAGKSCRYCCIHTFYTYS